MVIIGFILKIILALFVLSILVFIHELGHFLFAKWNKVAVLEFAIGFGKVLWQKKIGVTKYSLRLIPLGGFVRMAGDDYNKYYFDENDQKNKPSDPDKKLTFEPTPEVDPSDEDIVQDRSQWFFNKSIWRRSSIVFAGPLFNLVLAWILIFGVYITFGANEPIDKPIIGELIPDYPAEKAGLVKGDFIKSIDEKEIKTWSDLIETLTKTEGKAVQLEVLRTNQDNTIDRLNLIVQPKAESEELKLIEGKKDLPTRYLLGIQAPVQKVKIGIGEAMLSSTYNVYYTSLITIKSIWYLIGGQISAKHIGGPITIMKEVANSADKGIERLIAFMVFISISLGILNLLPIPVLDGGHLLLFALEALNRGRLNRKFLEYANQLGMFLLLCLMVFAIGNDLFRLVTQ